MNDPEPAEARFDPLLDAWILSSYREVSSALREPGLVISDSGPTQTDTHALVREAGAEYAHARLGEWRERMEETARELTERLPAERTTDLFRAFASPWSLGVAMMVAGADRSKRESLARLAGEVFLAAARAAGPGPESHALAAAVELARTLPSTPLAVQGFVALSHTLPHFLVSAWHALLSHPDAILQLRAHPELVPDAIEELLRFAGPSRAVFRKAIRPVRIGRAGIAPGHRVILMLASANRDPEQFPEPHRLDLGRGGAGHLAFGKGAHACAGAQLIRQAASIATTALLASTSTIRPDGEVSWVGGFAIHAPGSLPVVIGRQPR
jgi:cytochrome P450